jgi:hypothetical protein
MIASNGNNSDSSSQSGNLNNIFTCGFETPIDNSQFTLLTSAMNPGFDAGPPKMAPYNGSNSGSSTQSEEDPDNIFISNLEAATDNGQFVFISSNTNLKENFPLSLNQEEITVHDMLVKLMNFKIELNVSFVLKVTIENMNIQLSRYLFVRK